MSNTRRATGVPAALTRDGVAVPESPEVAEHSLAEVIGESAALHLAKVIGPLLEHIATTQYRPACLACAVAAKRAEQAWERDAAIRRQAAEPEPERPDAPVTESFTEGARGPVCWSHFDADKDGILDMDDYLPPPAD